MEDERKLNKYLKWGLLGCGCLMIFGFLASCAMFGLIISVSTDTTSETAKETKKESATPQAKKIKNKDTKDEKKEAPSYKIGDTVKAGDLEYKILSVESKKVIRDPLGSEYKPGGGQYLILELEIKNTGKEKITADQNMFKLKDSSGAEYSVDYHVDTWINERGTNSLGFFLESINPNATKKGKVAFDVPNKKAEDFTFVGEAGFFSFSDPAVIKLVQ